MFLYVHISQPGQGNLIDFHEPGQAGWMILIISAPLPAIKEK